MRVSGDFSGPGAPRPTSTGLPHGVTHFQLLSATFSYFQLHQNDQNDPGLASHRGASVKKTPNASATKLRWKDSVAG